MPDVFERVAATKEKIYEKMTKNLADKDLSQALRRSTWPDHERARHSAFEMSLVDGSVTEPAYRELVAQMLPVYEALEARAEELKGDPIGGPVVFPELNRAQALREDLEFYFGPDGAGDVEILPIAREYADRIKNSTPIQFVAHHYTRYLADLSGGLMIFEALKRNFGREEDGLRYYIFPGIDANEFKEQYRDVLDGLPLDATQKWDVIEESLVAYEYNVDIANQLAERHMAPVG